MGEEKKEGKIFITKFDGELYSFYEHFMEVYYVDVGVTWLEKKKETLYFIKYGPGCTAMMVDQPVTQINKKEFQTATCGKN